MTNETPKDLERRLYYATERIDSARDALSDPAGVNFAQADAALAEANKLVGSVYRKVRKLALATGQMTKGASE